MTDLLERPAPADAAQAPAPCPCGSGLTQPRCCGLDLRTVELAPPDGPHSAELIQITQSYRAGDLETVRRLALEVLEVSPGQRDALGALFNVLNADKKLHAAAAVVDRLAHIHVNDAVSRMVAAQFFLAAGEPVRAQIHGRMLVRLAPEDPVSHYIAGRAFLAIGNGQAAAHHFRIAKRLPGDSLNTRNLTLDLDIHLAVALRHQGELAEARAMFADLDARFGPNLLLLRSWAALEEDARDFQAALNLLQRAEALAPGNAPLAVARAALQRRMGRKEEALAVLEGVANELDAGVAQKGLILDSLGRYDEAFAAFETFKRLLRERGGQAYRAEEAAKLAEALRGFFTESRYPLLPRAEVRTGSPQPIFIVGFPRSGTTLIEQTLTSHPNISAGDELPMVNRIAERAQVLLGSPGPYPLALSELWLGDRAGHINVLRDLYLHEAAQAGAVDPAKAWFTDKMPLNETHLGLIHLMFPASPIIHLVRHPLDVVLSVFSNGLTHGFNCASSLETAAQHYALIADLIAHYRSVLPLNYHAVRYEDLVTDQEAQVRGLFDFIGEPFSPRTLDFHENARPARTASYAQVTEKLYSRSVYRYRNYLKHLEPVAPVLQPAIERLGYTVER